MTPDGTFRIVGDGRYLYDLPDLGITFDIDRLYWDHRGLSGELTVRCSLAGAKTIHDGQQLFSGAINLSNLRARQELARYLGQQARAKIDFVTLTEGFAVLVRDAERKGSPAVVLHEVPKPAADAEVDVDGLHLLLDHPTIWFSDGGSGKSLLGLYAAGKLEQRGFRVVLFDWELSAADHRLRLERLFGPQMPNVRYVRCTRPLVVEQDRLRRIVHDAGIRYAIYDSVAFACDGPPEAAEVAGNYFRAVRSIGIGSLHLAHVSKAENADRRPFGSSFWHNGARATWYLKPAEAAPDTSRLTLGLFHRKANNGPLRSARGIRFTFTDEQIAVDTVNPADEESLAIALPLRLRMITLLRGGAKTIVEIADELDAKADSVTKVLNRHKATFTQIIKTTDGVHRYGVAELRRVK
jgi:hypothetical protein